MTDYQLIRLGYKVTLYPHPDHGEVYGASLDDQDLGGAFTPDDAWEICRDHYNRISAIVG